MIELSVVVPTYQRRDLVVAAVRSLADQSLDPSRYEIVVVVDGSTDGTAAALRALATSCALRVEPIENGGGAAARNRGIELAVGDICVFVDDDILASRRLLEGHLAAHAERPVVVVGRLETTPAVGAGVGARLVAAELNDHYSRLDAGRPPGAIDCYGGNLSAPTAVIRAIGGFPTDMPAGVDIDVGTRLVAAGLDVRYAPDALGVQTMTKRAAELLEDVRRHGVAEVDLHRRHPGVLRRLTLATFGTGGLKRTLALRLLLAARVPPVRLAPLLRLRPSPGAWRTVSDVAFWTGVRSVVDHDTWRRLTHPPLILMYHAIGDRSETATMYRLPLRRFRWQLTYLRLRRRPVIGLDELAQHRREHRLPPAGSVVITFDDGYRDNATLALPLLRRRRWPATVFLVTSLAGQQNDWDERGELFGRAMLTWDDARALERGGVAVASHTHTHPRLTQVPDGIAEELATSREILERELGHVSGAFAYPYGVYDRAVKGAVRDARFDSAVTVHQGPAVAASDDYELPRLTVAGVEGVVRFALGLELWWLPSRLRSRRRPGRRAA